MKFAIADTHFGHKNIIKYCNRPFDTVEEMDDYMINRWNKVVDEEDTVYHLGDFALTNTKRQIEIFNQLNGNIKLIRGNHDHQTQTKLVDRIGFKSVHNNLIVNNFILSHRPINDNKLINIHGHTHNNIIKDKKHLCVSVERIDYTPIVLGFNFNHVLKLR